MLLIGDTGYIGTNLKKKVDFAYFHNRSKTEDELFRSIDGSEQVVHLAATQRAVNGDDFEDNFQLTSSVVNRIIESKTPKNLVFASSVHAEGSTEFGKSKRKEELLISSKLTGTPHTFSILRIPNTYGPHGRPFYNNVFATFAHCVWTEHPVTIRNPTTLLPVIHVDAVVDVIAEKLRYRLGGGTVFFRATRTINLTDLLFSMVEMRRVGRVIGRTPSCRLPKVYPAFLSYRPD